MHYENREWERGGSYSKESGLIKYLVFNSQGKYALRNCEKISEDEAYITSFYERIYTNKWLLEESLKLGERMLDVLAQIENGIQK